MIELPLAILLWMFVIILLPLTVVSVIGVILYLKSKD
jgi:hypothetical protein